MLRVLLFGAGLAAGMSCGFAMSAFGGVPGGEAIVLVATITPAADSLALPDPRSPAECVRFAPAGGEYDVWYYLFSRRPLAGAWTVDVAFGFDHRAGHGVDVVSWRSLGDACVPSASWPDGGSGHGVRVAWNRPDCFDSSHSDLFPGDDGWFRQPVMTLRVRVHDADALTLVECEPGVPSQVVSCFDDAFRLDGEDGWTAYRGPSWGGAATAAGPLPEDASPVAPTTWSALKRGRP